MAIQETPPTGAPTTSVSVPEAALYRGFFDAAREAMIVVDDSHYVVACNPAAHRLFGAADDAECGSFLDRIDPRDRSSVELFMREVLGRRHGTHELRVECVRVDGLSFSADLSVAPYPAEHEQLLAVVIRDRTLIERTQRRLRREQDLFRTLFMNAPVPLREEDFSAVGDWFDRLRLDGVADLGAYIDTHEREFVETIMKIKTVRVNPAFVRLMQAEGEAELLAGFQSAEFSKGTLQSFRRQFMILWEGGDYSEAEFIGYNRKGEPFECFVTVSVQRNNGELDLSRVVAAFLDLTEIRSNQRSLERLIADKDQFIASVSHELRTPLASVLGLSDELHNHWESFEPDEVRQLLGIIADQGGEMASLVEDLLVAAKTEMGSLAIHTEVLDLDHLVEDLLAELSRSDSLDRHIDIRGIARTAHADPVRVRQVVRNLVTNAVRYGGAEIWLEMGRENDFPFVRVVDDGEAIPEDERDRIFDPYHRATGDKAKLGALGLGLTISRQLARMMDGDLRYDYVDGNSVFTLSLPGGR